ncbi:enoyl-CoA hydratase/isomerase family protein [Conexibacter arvalis]|uniref:2-(1,2-epoxy-1,2-dihydrophenyl)acetyl-CoA isomerase n=1 Tax=Conexibacter arvalis TaxID=912552 RepID=A0A840IGK2_9ACTN|nr:enoyl-CoA hydratase-related protein [Conexibacter arvalis]MBB4663906.1 2-(1,2-epoxy-1,2-dihydrophenyl)acetyl-CoA isomerase [Conexibacter arvalis]
MSETLIADGPVLLELDGAVAHLRFNRPEASNGLDVPLLRALYEAVMRIHGEPRARAVLVTGEGRHFCAGGDVKTFAAKGEALPDYLREATSWLQISASALIRLRAPVIAAVHGFAAGGGGLGLVCASDLVIAERSATFMLGATRVGMAPDAGGSVTLTHLVGFRKAMEIALTNPAIEAEEALRIGLITRVVDDGAARAEGMALARELAAGPTLAYGQTKRLLWEGLGATVEARLPDEARTVAELSGSEDAREGLAAVIERRAPEYRGR